MGRISATEDAEDTERGFLPRNLTNMHEYFGGKRLAGVAGQHPGEQNSLCPLGASSFGPNLFCSGDFVALRSLVWVTAVAVTVMGGKDTKPPQADWLFQILQDDRDFWGGGHEGKRGGFGLRGKRGFMGI